MPAAAADGGRHDPPAPPADGRRTSRRDADDGHAATAPRRCRRPAARAASQRKKRQGRPAGGERRKRASAVSPSTCDALLRARVVDVPDYPKPGVVFKDITPAARRPRRPSPGGRRDRRATTGAATVDKVVGIEARGFILAAPVAYHFGAGFVPVRKTGQAAAARRTSGLRRSSTAATSSQVHQRRVRSRATGC